MDLSWGVTFMTACSTRSPAASWSMVRNIIAMAHMAAKGLITSWPVYLGAEPPMGSNMDTLSGLMFPPAAKPMPPWIMAPKSVMMSPNMLVVTMVS